MRGTVVVFARVPELGRVKTRLARALGEESTLHLYRAFLSDTLTLARRSGAEVVLAHTAGPEFPERALADRTVLQGEGSFGERMDGVLRDVAATLDPTTPYVILGADTPHLPPDEVTRALVALQEPTVTSVLGRCQAGGFYALGFRGRPLAIEPAFHRREEAEQVAEILRQADRPARELPKFFDVDTPEDLGRLIDHLRGTRTHTADEWRPPATLAALAELASRPSMVPRAAAPTPSGPESSRPPWVRDFVPTPGSEEIASRTGGSRSARSPTSATSPQTRTRKAAPTRPSSAMYPEREFQPWPKLR